MPTVAAPLLRIRCAIIVAMFVTLVLSCDRSSTSPTPGGTDSDSISQRFSVDHKAWIPDHVAFAAASDSGRVVPTVLEENLFAIRVPPILEAGDTVVLRFLYYGVVGSIYQLRLRDGALVLVKRTHLEPVRSAILLLDSMHAVSASKYPDDASGLRRAWVLGLFQSRSGFGSFPADRPSEFNADSVWLDAFRLVLDQCHSVAEHLPSWALSHDSAVVRSVADRFRSADILSGDEFGILYPTVSQPSSDSGKPALTLVSPSNDTVVMEAAQESLQVRVVVTDPDGIESVHVGGRPATISGDNQYVATVALPEAGKTDSIAVVAKDKNGTLTRRVIVVRRKEASAVADTIRPVIRLLSKIDSVVEHDQDSVLVRWSASDSGGIGKVQAGSASVSRSSDGTYQWRFPLSVGANPLTIHVEDVAGNKYDTTLNVRRKEAPANAVAASLPAGQYDTQRRVFLSVEGGGVIRYRIDGGEPDTNSPVFKDSILLDTSITLRARAWTAGGAGPMSSFTWRLVAGAVLVSDSSTHEHSGPFHVHASCATPGAKIRYTRNGDDPSSSSPEWSDSVVIDSTSTYRFRAFASGFEPSPVRTVVYKVAYVVDIASGGLLNSYFIKSDGSLWVAGQAGGAGLESGDAMSPQWLMDSVVDVTDGMAIRRDGSVWVWGTNDQGQAGIGSVAPVPTPRKSGVCVSQGGAKNAASVQATYRVICADGSMWTSGANQFGQLGVGDTLDRHVFMQVMSAADDAAGYSHSAALDQDGVLWTWGANFNGQLGDGTRTSRSTPGKTLLKEQKIVSIAAFSALTLAIAENGDLFSFGQNVKLMAGVGNDSVDVPVPTKIKTNVAQAAVGAYHAALVDRDGFAWTWGSNEVGQIGDGSGEDRSRPTRIMGDVKKVAATYWGTLFLKADGTVWATGSSESGSLGIGDTRTVTTPVRVKF